MITSIILALLTIILTILVVYFWAKVAKNQEKMEEYSDDTSDYQTIKTTAYNNNPVDA